MSDEREIVDEFAVPPDADGLAGLVRRMDANPKLELNPTVAPKTKARNIRQPPRRTGGNRESATEKLVARSVYAPASSKRKNPLARGGFCIAGAGFEPATFGL